MDKHTKLQSGLSQPGVLQSGMLHPGMPHSDMPQPSLLQPRLEALWHRFGRWEIPVHSLMVAQGGETLWESYRLPYGEDTLHRMFSITKSYCSLAVGSLVAEGKLALDDPIVQFFPEYLGNQAHPYLAGMTIRHMLAMQTCHSATTYKRDPTRDWVGSFFTTPPTHRSGQIFSYDTSSSHTLAALVKKLSGMGVLDYLRGRFLDAAGFSQSAYILCDPFGAEMGGSGLMARPSDLMVTAQYLMGQLSSGQGAFADYLRAAVSLQVPTLHFGQCLDEQLGYGYQFWRVRGGFAMYGMGGQYVLCYPESGLIVVITADSQNIKGGTQKILDAVYEGIGDDCGDAGATVANIDDCHDVPVPRATMGDCHDAAPAPRVCKDTHSLADQTWAPWIPLAPYNQPANHTSPSTGTIGRPGAGPAADGVYKLLPNQGGFTQLTFSQDTGGGILALTHPDMDYQIPFGWETASRATVLGNSHQPAVSSGKWLDGHSLLIYTQLVGECVGSLSFVLSFHDSGVTLWMRKIEETMFEEFCGFAEGSFDSAARTSGI